MEWIPVKNGLPKKSGNYIVTIKTGYWLEKILESFGVPDASGYYSSSLYFDAEEKLWYNEARENSFEIVTAWMDYPEAYTGE